MARSRIDRDDAYTIASKIGAEVTKAGKHARAILRVHGKIILTFGIRHGPKSGHGHLCGEKNGALRMNEGDVVSLARCHMDKDAYLQVLRGKGLLPPN